MREIVERSLDQFPQKGHTQYLPVYILVFIDEKRFTSCDVNPNLYQLIRSLFLVVRVHVAVISIKGVCCCHDVTVGFLCTFLKQKIFYTAVKMISIRYFECVFVFLSYLPGIRILFLLPRIIKPSVSLFKFLYFVS